MSSHRQGGRVGLTAKLVVVNRAQRCEFHKLAVFLVGGGSEVLCADLMLVAILVKYESARNFERPPTHPALCRQRVHLTLGASGSASVQQLFLNVIPSSGRAGGSHCKVCGKYHLFRMESFRVDFRCVHRLQLLRSATSTSPFQIPPAYRAYSRNNPDKTFLSKLMDS